MALIRFRPLSRLIGGYTAERFYHEYIKGMFEFSASPEVERCPIPHFDYGAVDCYQFPAPLEVDRQLYYLTL